MEKSVLHDLGLTEKEADVYLALLRARSATVNEIAAKCGLHRQVIYDILDRLVEKGLASFIQKDSKKHFSAMPPQRLIENLKETEERLEKIMPELVALTHLPKEEAEVRVIHGNEVVTTVLKGVFNIMKSGEAREQLVMGADDRKYVRYSPVYMKKFISLIEKNNFRERILAREGDIFFVGGKTSEYKFIPREFFNPTATHIAGNMVAIIIWTTPPTGIIIESSEVADSYRKYFNLLWKIAKIRKWRKRAD